MSTHPIPWRLNLLIVAAQVTTAAVVFWLASAASAWWQLGLLAIGFAILGNSIYASMHEAEHGILLPWRRWNNALGAFLGLFFPAPFHMLRQGHLGHHYRNRSDDEAFDLYFDGDNPVWKWLQLYGILSGFFWLTIVLSNVCLLVLPTTALRRLLGFDRPSAACWDSFNPRYWRLIRCEAAAAIAFHALVVWSFGIPLASYAIVYFGFGLSWSAMQYVHHFGTERDVVNGARNLWLLAPVDAIWLHHNWHHTHHQQPTVPWIYLPELSRCQKTPRQFLLWHYLRMWRGPRYTDVHVENRYAGRVIR
jgi:fatty acid desaturase